jgi:hypothetical protein
MPMSGEARRAVGDDWTHRDILKRTPLIANDDTPSLGLAKHVSQPIHTIYSRATLAPRSGKRCRSPHEP